ncbi:MAG: hypothetical protein Q8L20_12520 [Gammaproteobacteria bacterium]|nr:hypothetical protein [Gammaproteobacteria bacterium]
METANVWEYLDNVWVLTGLVLVVFAGLLKSLSSMKLDNPAVERLMNKGVNYLFILGLVGIILGFVLPGTKNTDAPRITQTIDTNTGGAFNAGRDVNSNQSSLPAPDRPRSERPNTVNQQIKENSGIAINAGGDVSTNIPEK